VPSLLVYDIEDEVHGLSPRVLEFPSCERFRNRVHEGHGTAHILGDHGVTDAGKSCREPLFTFSQRFLRAFAFGEFVEKEYKTNKNKAKLKRPPLMTIYDVLVKACFIA